MSSLAKRIIPEPDPPAFEVRVIEDPHQPPVDRNAEMALLDNHFVTGMTGGHFRKGHPKTESHGVFLLTVRGPFP